VGACGIEQSAAPLLTARGASVAINLASAPRARLTISAKRLSPATIVKDSTNVRY
jgi:hypothetical protein